MRRCAHDWSAEAESFSLSPSLMRRLVKPINRRPLRRLTSNRARRVDAIVRQPRVPLLRFDLGFRRRSASPPSSSYEATSERHRDTGITLHREREKEKEGGGWFRVNVATHVYPRTHIHTHTEQGAHRREGCKGGQRGARVDRQHRGGPGPCLAAFSVYGPIA